MDFYLVVVVVYGSDTLNLQDAFVALFVRCNPALLSNLLIWKHFKVLCSSEWLSPRPFQGGPFMFSDYSVAFIFMTF